MSSSDEESSGEEEFTYQPNGFVPNYFVHDTDIACATFHPTQNVLAVGDMNGKIIFNSFSNEETNVDAKSTVNAHKDACRILSFSSDGRKLFSGSKAKSIKIIDVESGKVKKTLKREEPSPVYAILPIDSVLIASGDDAGVFTLWDYRAKKAVFEDKQCDDYISSLALSNKKKYVLATSGEGTLSCFDIRQRKLHIQSELFDSELLSSSFVKNDAKLVVGTGEGVLNIFNWGEWSNFSDRFPVHSHSIDTMVPLSKNVIAIGSSDGSIQAINIQPNQILTNIGTHSDFPIQSLALSHDKTFLASSAYDNKVKFYNVGQIVENENKMVIKNAKRRDLAKKLEESKKNFFSDL